MLKFYSSAAAALHGDDIYFSARDYNALLRTDIVTGETEYITRFDEEERIGRLHSKAFAFGSNIWFIPLFGTKIAKFCVDTTKIDYFEIDSQRREDEIVGSYGYELGGEWKRPLFFDAGYIDEKNVYLTPSGVKDMLILNLETGNVEYIDISEAEGFLGASVYFNDEVWIETYLSTVLYAVNPYTKKVRKISLSFEIGDYGGMCCTGDKIWMISRDNYLCSYSPSTLMVNEYKNTSNIYMDTPCAIRDLLFWRDEIWMLPGNVEKLCCFNPKEESFLEKNVKENYELGIMVAVGYLHQNIVLLSFSKAQFVILGEQTTIINIEVDEKDLSKVLRDNYGDEILRGLPTNGVITEEEIGLNNYLELLTQKESK